MESESASETEVGRAGGIFRIEPLWRQWYVVARSKEVKSKPLRVELWDKPFVLFRGPNGELSALLDRCPHRNVPLSGGRVDERGCLECPYHGWTFDDAGSCVAIPGRVLPLAPRERFAVPRFPVREDHGLIWLCPSELGALSEPFPVPHLDDARYTHVIREVEADASLYSVIENALDVPHTAVLHRGLFRGSERNRVQARVERFDDRVVTEYIGEPPPRGLLARLLSIGGDRAALTVQHWDRFFLPSVLQVEYRLGERTHFVITGLCSPVSRHKTRLFAVASFRTPLPGKLLALLLEPVGRLVFSQDARLLKKQTQNILAFGGEHFVSTELDAVGPPLFRVIQAAARREKEGLSPVRDADAAPQVSEFEIEA